jgi:hypothetical protein
MSPQSRHASSTQASRGARGSATASRPCIDERVRVTALKYAGAGSEPRCLLARRAGTNFITPDRWVNPPWACSCGRVLTVVFARIGQAMRTIEVTSVAPRAWACSNASSADAAWNVCSATKETVNWRRSLERLRPAVRARRLWVEAGAEFAAGVSIDASTLVRRPAAAFPRRRVPDFAPPTIGATVGSAVWCTPDSITWP